MSRGLSCSRQKDKDYLYGKRSFGKKGQFITVTGTVSRFGRRHNIDKGGILNYKTTACIQDVFDLKGNKLTDHVWIDIPKESRYKVGDILKFEGQVNTYSKLDYDFGGYKTNYELRNVRNISVVK